MCEREKERDIDLDYSGVFVCVCVGCAYGFYMPLIASSSPNGASGHIRKRTICFFLNRSPLPHDSAAAFWNLASTTIFHNDKEQFEEQGRSLSPSCYLVSPLQKAPHHESSPSSNTPSPFFTLQNFNSPCINWHEDAEFFWLVFSYKAPSRLFCPV